MVVPTVPTDSVAHYPGVYRCAKCNTAEQVFELPDEVAPPCPNCKKPVLWIYVRGLQPFAW